MRTNEKNELMKERMNESSEQLHEGDALIMETNENLKTNKIIGERSK